MQAYILYVDMTHNILCLKYGLLHYQLFFSSCYAKTKYMCTHAHSELPRVQEDIAFVPQTIF